VKAWIGLGSNIGDGPEELSRALEAMAGHPGIRLRGQSSLYDSEPWGEAQQPDFTNAVVVIDTRLTAEGLLKWLLTTERRLGRKRHGQRWGPRVIDLDLLMYEDQIIETPELMVPHPRIRQRAFVLLPLAELNERMAVPGQGMVRELLDQLPEQGVKKLAPNRQKPWLSCGRRLGLDC